MNWMCLVSSIIEGCHSIRPHVTVWPSDLLSLPTWRVRRSNSDGAWAPSQWGWASNMLIVANSAEGPGESNTGGKYTPMHAPVHACACRLSKVKFTDKVTKEEENEHKLYYFSSKSLEKREKQSKNSNTSQSSSTDHRRSHNNYTSYSQKSSVLVIVLFIATHFAPIVQNPCYKCICYQ